MRWVAYLAKPPANLYLFIPGPGACANQTSEIAQPEVSASGSVLSAAFTASAKNNLMISMIALTFSVCLAPHMLSCTHATV